MEKGGVALAGAGEPAGKDRRIALERAGAALTARFLTSGESTLTLDFTGTRLDADGVAAVLLGARLQAPPGARGLSAISVPPL